MNRRVAAIYENGALRLLEPVDLEEHQRVLLQISADMPPAARSRPDTEYREAARRKVAAMRRVPSLDEVRERLSKIPGSLIDDFIGERGER